jgi:hypothetical protein
VFRAPEAVPPPRQQRPHPPRRDAHPRRLRQVGAQSVARPGVEQQPQGPRRRVGRPLQRRQVRPVGPWRSARPGGVGHAGDAPGGEGRQPAPHGALGAPAPPRDLGQRVPERHGLDHLQPLAHPRGQVPSAQRRFHHRPRLAGGPHPGGRLVFLVAHPAPPPPRGCRTACELTSDYLGRRGRRAWSSAGDDQARGTAGAVAPAWASRRTATASSTAPAIEGRRAPGPLVLVPRLRPLGADNSVVDYAARS